MNLTSKRMKDVHAPSRVFAKRRTLNCIHSPATGGRATLACSSFYDANTLAAARLLRRHFAMLRFHLQQISARIFYD